MLKHCFLNTIISALSVLTLAPTSCYENNRESINYSQVLFKKEEDMMQNVTVINHPLILDKLTRLRNEETQKKAFMENLNEISSLMVYKVFENLPVKDIKIKTPVTKMIGKTVVDNIVLCPVLRAGLGMVGSFQDLVPNASVSHIGMYRDEETLQPKEYFFKYPDHIEKPLVYILDPMLATGGSAIAAIEKVLQKNPAKVALVAIIASPEGIEKVRTAFPDLEIYVCSIDEKLNEHGYIVPGLGDAGDRIFGTK